MGTMPLIPLPTMLLFIILLPITLPFTILLPTTLLFTILLPTTLPYMQPLTTLPYMQPLITLPHIMVQYLVVLPPYMQPLTSLPPILSPLPYLVHMLQKKHKSLVKTLLHLCQGCFNPYLLLLLYFKC